MLAATPGSAHGYDVVDHTRLSPELGGDEGWGELVAGCRTHGLGLVVDLVPNHMAVPEPERLNAALWDVLARGPASLYAPWFDIDWDMHDGRVLLPVLGHDLDGCLAAGEVTVDGDAGTVRYFDHAFPLRDDGPDTDDARAVLAAQHYRLAHWRAAATALNYRRFFDVTSLIGVRVERREVFDATHARVLDLVRAGDVDGLRIDHPDGLADPRGYLDRLQVVAGGVWTVVEKILEPGEDLPSRWACAGTTGYDAITAITHLLVDPAGADPLTNLYVELTGEPGEFETVVERSKRFVLDLSFGSEVERLLRDLRPARASDDASGVTDDVVRRALAELLVAFDVYRAYAGDPASARRIDAAVERAASRAPEVSDAIRWVGRLLHRERPEAEPFAVRFEQTTGPVMAKGVEDTAFYRYHRLVALNEVGGDPGAFGLPVGEWHVDCTRRAVEWPASMTTLSTHDTKRSEDVRARLLVLAETPDEWRAALTRWRAAAARHGPPDANTDYLFWQTLVGAWPIGADRMNEYLRKAAREAKQQTSWTDPHEDYERSLAAYVDGVLADDAVVTDVARWVDDVVRRPGEVNALAQKLLQLTMPGIPDVYQGQEMEERTLVDPDNRRPVDYAVRRTALASLGRDFGDTKLRLTAAALRLRRDRPDAFAKGYTPVDVTGPAAEHAVAYLRGDDVLVVVTRLPVGLARRGGWGDTTLALPDGTWYDVVEGRPAARNVGVLLAETPVALLARQDG